MAQFQPAFERLSKIEGGYVNNKNDKGGETFMGICRKYYPNNYMWTLIDKIKLEVGNKVKLINERAKKSNDIINQVRGIYRQNYWNKLRLDEVPSQKIAQNLFDDAVNRGVAAAIKTAQKLVKLPITGRMSNELINRLSKYGQIKY